jgi:hypothetical protein
VAEVRLLPLLKGGALYQFLGVINSFLFFLDSLLEKDIIILAIA